MVGVENWGGGGGGGGQPDLCQFFPIPPGIPKIGIGKIGKELKNDQKESA